MTLKLASNASDGARERSIIVAVDIGTTFSGVAWAQTAQPNQQITIVQWPNTEGSLEGQTSEKAPTELCFSDGTVRWGFQIPEDEQRYQWFKLGLDPEHEKAVSYLSVHYPDPKALPPAYGGANSPVLLATMCLRCLREHTLHVLKLKLGEGVVNSTPLRFIITVPAICDDAAKARAQRCGVDAGMGNDIRIILEPKDAVVFALSSMDHHIPSPGDSFVLCDAGGGMVDLISYSIVELQPLLKVREAVPGSGHACGSTFLNCIFGRVLEEDISDAEGYDDDTIDEALRDFETSVKRKFRGEEESVMIRVRGLVDRPEKGIKRGRLTVSRGKMKSLFEPVIYSIITLATSQLKQTKQAKAVILVGGLGQSSYLRAYIIEVVGNKIEVIQPVEGWTAVVKGALIKGLSETVPDSPGPCVAIRVSRKSYGVRGDQIFNPLVHDNAKK
ncbi:uncharacterized protein A1O9_04674 [Exophiala aquamarina CBS 119918]|uniref:Hsp70-like protein n=1 Tax=Exophiala aquamarina CBS 119918 TaxID=1182545 RepID=A0A072PIZ4_9EURO|nr:uncharacterized protein A1O9_04674 [Exophiala aquamarina CBS 119918]KEF59826.1 hypothetical protein A1O9_04674 [Exophiala aquamarina CBS 119918]